jgi:hypothetical protein
MSSGSLASLCLVFLSSSFLSSIPCVKVAEPIPTASGANTIYAQVPTELALNVGLKPRDYSASDIADRMLE